MEGFHEDERETSWSRTWSNGQQPGYPYQPTVYAGYDGYGGVHAHPATKANVSYVSGGPYTSLPGLTPNIGLGEYAGASQAPIHSGYQMNQSITPSGSTPTQTWHNVGGFPPTTSVIRPEAQSSQRFLGPDRLYSNNARGSEPAGYYANVSPAVSNPPSGQYSREVPIAMATGPVPDTGRRPSTGSLPDTSYSIQCPCGETLTGAHANGNLTRHRRSQKCTASIEKRSYACQLCTAKFQRSDALLNHRRKRHGYPPGQPRTYSRDEE